MKKVLKFNETQVLDNVLNRFESAARDCQLTSVDIRAGESLIRTFYSALQDSAAIGNRVRMEKKIRGSASELHVVAFSGKQRMWLANIFPKLWGH